MWNDAPKEKDENVMTRSNTLESLTAISSIVSDPIPQKPERDDLLPPVEVANTDSAFSVSRRSGFLRKVKSTVEIKNQYNSLFLERTICSTSFQTI